MDEDGICSSAFGDGIANEDLNLGPRFSIVVPGMEEWARHYELATDFAETTTDPYFDWRSWHYEGLCFAKAIWEQLPRSYSLYYKPPFEDNSNTIGKIEIDENIDALIAKLCKDVRLEASAPSFIDNLEYKSMLFDNGMKVIFRIGALEMD